MPKTLRQQLEDLRAENEELQEIVDDYENRFDAIQGELPTVEEDEDSDSGEE